MTYSKQPSGPLQHPFELELSDLDLMESADSDAPSPSGGYGAFTKALFEHGGPIFTTLALGEEGGDPGFPEPIHPPEPPTPPCRPIKPGPFPIKPPVGIKPPFATTQALGEEGGGYFPPIAFH